MPRYISRLVQLCKDVLGKDFTKFNSHLIFDKETEKRWVECKRLEQTKKKKSYRMNWYPK